MKYCQKIKNMLKLEQHKVEKEAKKLSFSQTDEVSGMCYVSAKSLKRTWSQEMMQRNNYGRLLYGHACPVSCAWKHFVPASAKFMAAGSK